MDAGMNRNVNRWDVVSRRSDLTGSTTPQHPAMVLVLPSASRPGNDSMSANPPQSVTDVHAPAALAVIDAERKDKETRATEEQRGVCRAEQRDRRAPNRRRQHRDRRERHEVLVSFQGAAAAAPAASFKSRYRKCLGIRLELRVEPLAPRHFR